MSVGSSSSRIAILLIHDDGVVLDALTRLLEARAFEVAIAATGFAALTQLQSEREFAVIIAGWDAGGGIGAETYEWVLAHSYDLRNQFVFLASDPPLDFDDVVQGRCLLLHPDDYEEIVRVAVAQARHHRQRATTELPADAIEWSDDAKPSLLLVEDDPMQLFWMKRLLDEVGFSITSVESGNAAIGQLEVADFDVILSDWYMASGSGAELYQWLTRNRPHLVSRCVFMSAVIPDEDSNLRAPGRPIIPKGQDSPALVRHLLAIVQEVRGS